MLSPRKFHHLFHRRDSTFLQKNVGLSEATRGTHGRRLMSEIEPILNPPAPPAGTADGATRMQNFIERVKVPQATRASIAVLLAMFLCGASSTEFVAHVALVPGRTIPYLWNVFTASWLEVNPLGFIVSCAAAILTGASRGEIPYQILSPNLSNPHLDPKRLA